MNVQLTYNLGGHSETDPLTFQMARAKLRGYKKVLPCVKDSGRGLKSSERSSFCIVFLDWVGKQGKVGVIKGQI